MCWPLVICPMICRCCAGLATAWRWPMPIPLSCRPLTRSPRVTPRTASRLSSNGGSDVTVPGEIAEQHHVAKLPDLCERHRVLRALWESIGIHESGGTSVTDEKRRDHEVDLVHESGAEELSMNCAAALY